MPDPGDKSTALIQAFGGVRMAIGVFSWVAPSFTARLFGLGPDSTQPIVSQLFGAREFALGCLTATSSGTTQQQVLRVGVMIDAADALASLRQIREGNFSAQAAILVGAGAAVFAAIGVAALRGEDVADPAGTV